MDITTIKPNTSISFIFGDQKLSGLVLPREGDLIVIKLNSGYNMGVLPEHISDVKIMDQDSQKTPVVKGAKQNTNLSKLKILHTGGTIASRVDYKTGGVIADFSPEMLLSLFPELQDIVYVESEFLGNMWSDDFRFSHFNRLAQGVLEGAKKGIKNFIVTSGTDFLHYASAALSFLLKDVPVGVLVVGSQRSSDRGSTDAAMNLICAAQFLADTEFKGVGVCMHENSSDDDCIILPGIHTRKMHSSRRDAFKSINASPIAKVNYTDRSILLYKELEQRKGIIPQTIPLLKEDLKIGMIYSRPNLYAEELFVYKKFDGLVLVGSGLGHFPVTKVDETCIEHEKIFSILSNLAKTIPVVMSTQTIYGRVHMNVYSPGRALQQSGVLGHLSSMTPETSYIKLAWLLSNYSKEEIPALFMKNILGELDPIKEDMFMRGNE